MKIGRKFVISGVFHSVRPKKWKKYEQDSHVCGRGASALYGRLPGRRRGTLGRSQHRGRGAAADDRDAAGAPAARHGAYLSRDRTGTQRPLLFRPDLRHRPQHAPLPERGGDCDHAHGGRCVVRSGALLVVVRPRPRGAASLVAPGLARGFRHRGGVDDDRTRGPLRVRLHGRRPPCERAFPACGAGRGEC